MDFRVVATRSMMGDAVERYAQLESQGWKGKEGTALRPGGAQCRFYTEVLERFSGLSDHEGLAFELYYEGRLVASRLCIANESILVALKTAYDESIKAIAPGRLLLKETLEYLAASYGSRPIEFYTKATRDQLAWATATREIVHISIYANAFYRTLSGWKEQFNRRRAAAIWTNG